MRYFGSLNYSASLIALMLYSLGVALSNGVFISYFAPLIFALIFSKDKLTRVLKRLFILNIFVLLSVASVLLSQNYNLAWLIFLRSNLLIFFSLLLFSGINKSEFLRAFSALNLGKKINSLIYFSLSFTSSLNKDLIKLQNTLKARGFRPKTSIFGYKIYANLLALLLILAIQKLQSTQKTLKARNYKGYILNPQKLNLHRQDYALLALCALCLVFKMGAII
ncbi:MAG: cobalt/nickel ECF transporter CbiMNQO, T component CbiQ [Candidatus Campylobacter infans]|nr:MAG: cobalt/nickel ECF transporter CbiMNQO, T component CbiQ [Candidatus Campylobacter infans]